VLHNTRASAAVEAHSTTSAIFVPQVCHLIYTVVATALGTTHDWVQTYSVTRKREQRVIEVMEQNTGAVSGR